MVKRIAPPNERVAQKEGRAIADLHKLFPDGVIDRGISTANKKLGERLTGLYQEIGYESREAMLEAWGFTLAFSRSGGRPRTASPDKVLDEIAKRYEGKQKPATVGQIKDENPDLAGSLKTIANDAKNLFGQTLAMELKARGILEGKKPRVPSDRVRAGKKGNPRKAFTDEDGVRLSNFLRQLEKESAQVPEREKPSSIVKLCAKYPGYSDLIRWGTRSGLTSKEQLRERGILGRSKTELDRLELEERKRRIATSVWKLPLSELKSRYLDMGCPELIVPGDNADLLRSGVVGIDLANELELREANVVFGTAAQADSGSKVEVRLAQTNLTSGARDIEFICGSELLGTLGYSIVGPSPVYGRIADGSFFDAKGMDEVAQSSPLLRFEEAWVKETSRDSEFPMTKVGYRCVRKLSEETLRCALLRSGFER